jgi:hypothetical protein
MTVEDYIRELQEITRSVQTGQDGAWAYAAERTADWLKGQLSETSNLKNNIQYMTEGVMFTVLAPSYILYQNYGVAGALGNSKGARPDEFSDGRVHQYGTSRPPASVFSTYTTDKAEQFAIATSVYKFGIPPKSWFTRDILTQRYVDFANEFIANNNNLS